MAYRILIGLVFCLGLTPGLPAQSVESLILEHISSLGGRDRLDSVGSLELKGTIQFQGFSAPVTLRMKRPAKMRMDITIQGRMLTKATDGSTAWQIVPFSGDTAPKKLPPVETSAMADSSEIGGVLVNHADRGSPIALLGKVSLDDAEALHLKITKPDGQEISVFIDTEKHREIRRLSRGVVNEKEVEVVTDFSDYRSVEGLEVPFSQQVTSPEWPAFDQTIQWDVVQINPAIDDLIFQMPAR